MQTSLLFPDLIDPKTLDAGDASDGWYTPSWVVEKARSVLGTIDLDPATCEAAQAVVKAAHFYTEHEDGLIQPWYGILRVNPRKYGIMCPCQNKRAAQNVGNLSLRHWNISHHGPRKQTGLPHGVESVTEQKNEFAFAIGALLASDPRALRRLSSVLASVPNASNLTLLQTFILAAVLVREPALHPYAASVSVRTLGLSRPEDAQILWSEISSSLRNSDMHDHLKGGSANACNHKPIITNADNADLNLPGTGPLPIGNNASGHGMSAAPTAAQAENSPKIISSLFQTSNVPVLSQETLSPHASGATVPNNTDPPTSGAPILLSSGASSITLPVCPHGCDDVTIFYPQRLWINPPYSAPTPWVRRLLSEWRSGDVTAALMITNSYTETGWWQELATEATILFFKGRLNFWHPAKTATQNRTGQTLAYLGPDRERFIAEFGTLGVIR